MANSSAAQLIQNCDAHKFETMVTAVVDGQPEQKKIRLCGVEGQSDADWIRTLNDAVRKLEADQQMAANVRDQIIAAINSEIARLKITATLPPANSSRVETSLSPALRLSNDYSALPPLPGPVKAPSATSETDFAKAPVGRAAPAEPIEKDFAQLPPLPPPQPRSPGSVFPLAVAKAPIAAPRLKFGCDTPSDFSTDAPCADFVRETTLTIHAADDIPSGTSLEFVRNNEPRADVPLDGLKRGGTLRFALPAKVCSGFVSGKLELKIVHSEGEGLTQPLSSEGPYSLSC